MTQQRPPADAGRQQQQRPAATAERTPAPTTPAAPADANARALSRPDVRALPQIDRDIRFGDHGFKLATIEEAYRFAQYVVQAKLAPKAILEGGASAVVLCVQAGAELGFTPMRSLASVTIINGRPGLMGDAALAKIRTSGVCAKMPRVWNEGTGDDFAGCIAFTRKDDPEPVTVTFTVREAKAAGLLAASWSPDKANAKPERGGVAPWTGYVPDMLIWRAVARAGRRYFSDVLLGIRLAEELGDIPADEPGTRAGGVVTARDVTPPPGPDPLLERATETRTVAGELEPPPVAESRGDDDTSSRAAAATAEVLDDAAAGAEPVTREREPGEDDGELSQQAGDDEDDQPLFRGRR